MKIYHSEFEIQTQGKGTYELTDAVRAAVTESEVRSGLVTIFVRHTSCGLILMENADPSARIDLHEFFERLVPEGTPWFRHTSEGPDDMPSHIRSVLTRHTETLPVINGRVQLGTWQGVFLFEHRTCPHRRSLIISVLGDC